MHNTPTGPTGRAMMIPTAIPLSKASSSMAGILVNSDCARRRLRLILIDGPGKREATVRAAPQAGRKQRALGEGRPSPHRPRRRNIARPPAARPAPGQGLAGARPRQPPRRLYGELATEGGREG